jgi:hypothetical protein
MTSPASWEDGSWKSCLCDQSHSNVSESSLRLWFAAITMQSVVAVR